MKLVYLGHARPLDRSGPISGSDQRAAELKTWLGGRGDELHLVAPASAADESADCSVYRDPAELEQLLSRLSPDALLVGLWDLLADLPDRLQLPVIADLVAPRILESVYEPRSLHEALARMTQLLRRADHFLVGNQRQRDLQVGFLMMAGFDLSERLPVDVVPLTGEVADVGPRLDPGETVELIAGGVNWPWRQDQAYLDAVNGVLDHQSGAARLTRLSRDPDRVDELLPYSEFEAVLGRSHVGLELAQPNVERQFSRSFRLMEYLRHGLPVIVNDYIDLAPAIREADAGWVVSSPGELADTIRRIVPMLMESPGRYRGLSDNALQLARCHYDRAQNFAPLGRYLDNPTRVKLRPAVVGTSPVPSPGAAAPPRATGGVLWDSLKRRGGDAFWRGICRIMRPLCQRRGVRWVMVTRSDLFPANHGAAVKIVRSAEAVSREVGTVAVVTDDPRRFHLFENGQHRELPYPAWLRLLRLPAFLGNARLRALGLPVNELGMYRPMVDRGFVLRSLYLSLAESVEVFHAEFPAYARPCILARNLLGGSAMMVEHNVEYQRIEQQYPGVAGSPASGFLRGVEIGLANQCDAVVTVSQPDADTLERDGVAPHLLTVIPHGVELDQSRSVEAVNVRAEFGLGDCDFVVVFHGQYGYRPNLEAISLVASQLLPAWQQRGLDCQVLAIGPEPPRRKLHPRLHFTGPVASVAPYLKDCDLAVVPLQEGGGTRMKVLDYFAAGVPVVITTKGVEGIPVHSGQELIIEDDLGRMAEVVAELLENPARRTALVEQANRFVETLDWRNIGRRYVDLFS
ncbi:MAG: glycosyltransferase [Xanthomonadales bacterium]|nr:glycosyltransferase [Xanthomonadales bacterium]